LHKNSGNATSTGLPDRRFKARSISPVSGAKGAGAMLIFNIVVAAIDQYEMWSNIWDRKALEEQSMALENSVFVVNKHIGLIPDD